MKVKRCSNCKLFYDSEVFSQCPHCEKEEIKKPEAAPEKEAREIYKTSNCSKISAETKKQSEMNILATSVFRSSISFFIFRF